MGFNYVQISSSSLQSLVTQPFLDMADVKTELQQVRSVTVAEHMAVHVFGDSRPFYCLSQHLGRPVLTLRLAFLIFEDIFLWAVCPQVCNHHLLHILGEGDIAVLVSLAVTDVDGEFEYFRSQILKMNLDGDIEGCYELDALYTEFQICDGTMYLVKSVDSSHLYTLDMDIFN